MKRSQTPEILGSEDDPSNPYPREMLNAISNQSDKNPNSVQQEMSAHREDKRKT